MAGIKLEVRGNNVNDGIAETVAIIECKNNHIAINGRVVLETENAERVACKIWAALDAWA